MLLGNVISSNLPCFFLKDVDGEKQPELFKQRVFNMLALQACAAVVQLAFNCFIHKEKPDMPPSPAAAVQSQEDMTT